MMGNTAVSLYEDVMRSMDLALRDETKLFGALQAAAPSPRERFREQPFELIGVDQMGVDEVMPRGAGEGNSRGGAPRNQVTPGAEGSSRGGAPRNQVTPGA